MKSYDVLVVGAGTAGQTAAYLLKKGGLKVAVAEQSEFPGGICALAGCQAKKWFYEAAEIVARSRHLSDKGISEAAGDWGRILEEKNKFTAGIPDSTVEGFYETGIDYLEGPAVFTGPGRLSVEGEPIRSRFIILATGATPMDLPIKGAKHLVFSDAFLDLPALPRRIVFVGGGFISFEFAHFAARLGAPESELHILEAADRPLVSFDADMVDLLVEASAKEGIHVHTGAAAASIEPRGESFRVSTRDGRSFEADLVVHGAGRSPRIRGLDLDAAGIDHGPQGIRVDHSMRTSDRTVFAVGDCAATIQLARVADFEATVAARNILAEAGLGEPESIDYRFVPAQLFTYPQLAKVGATEAELEKAGIVYQKSFGRDLRWPTYRRVGLENAAYKILTDPDGQILGAHFLSDNASGMANTVKMAMITGMGAADLRRHSVMSPYPSRESDLIYMLAPLAVAHP